MSKKLTVFILSLICVSLIVLSFSGCIKITRKQPASTSPEPSTTVIGLPSIKSFTASPQNIKPGEQSELSWVVSGADTVTISPGVGNVSSGGTVKVNPASTTTYTLTATSTAGDSNAQATVSVGAAEGRPDLIVTDIFILADSLYFTVKNTGSEASGGNRAYLYINNVKTSDVYTEPLKPGEEKTIVFNTFVWPYPVQTEQVFSPQQKLLQYIVRVCVDAENAITESDETNNCHAIIMGAKLKYGFVEYAHLASWANAAGKLTFPTPAGNSLGSIFTGAGMLMEDGRSHSSIIATYPQPVSGGYISGRYSEFYTEDRVQQSRAMEIPDLSRFTATVGFHKDASPNAVAKFTFMVIDDVGGKIYSEEIIARNDGVLDYFDIDLSSMAGQKRHFLLRVDSMGEPGKDLAIWIDPKIAQ